MTTIIIGINKGSKNVFATYYNLSFVIFCNLIHGYDTKEHTIFIECASLPNWGNV
jgi:hypothetical protein